MGRKQELVQVVEGFFEKGHDKAMARKIGEWRQAKHAEEMKNLPDGRPVNKCASIELCRVLLDRIIDDGERLRKLTLMDPVLFFYAVAMAEEIFEADPGFLLLDDDDGKRAADPGRRALLLPKHIILLYVWYAKTNASQDSIAIQVGIGQKTVSRYITKAKELLSRTLPTPRKYHEHIKRQTDLEELKKILPGPGRGTCIEDGTLCRVKRPGQKDPRDTAYNGRKKDYMANTLFRFNARGEAIAMSPTVEGTVNDITMAKTYGLDLGIATDRLHDSGAPASDCVHRLEDGGFRGIEAEEPGAVYERTVGYKAYQKLDEKGKARNKDIAARRMPAEWFFGRVKRYARLRNPYSGTYSELNDELNVAAGLVNLHLMGGGARKGTGHAKKPRGKRRRKHRRDLEKDRRDIRMAEPRMEDWIIAP